ncbi:hypothetical protein Ddye_013045 [Dipteronia dyeriana]|uniref:Photosystem I P700 apoprotein A1 n=1 Tax=Dipteronia dyeriana TaxID=168575 RepID=A0AAD9X5J2_9ROSI|nr:hypothetical protein Ddye_013045 [Dipteronia dyeriana]
MIICSPKPEVKILVDRDPIKTSFEEWARPCHFSRIIAKGPDTTTWIWNLHVDAHDFDSHTSDLEEISRKVFSAHFRQHSIIFLASNPTHIRRSDQVVRPIMSQEILNSDVGGATNYETQLLLFTHHMWIGGFLIVGVATHATIFMISYTITTCRCSMDTKHPVFSTWWNDHWCNSEHQFDL